jgi:hypothetical protein
MSNRNLHKIPANFNSKRRGYPFKVFLKKQKDIYKCTIDPYSMVYSYFDEKEVKINGLETEYTVKNGDHLIITLNYTNKGLTITSASLSIKSGDFKTEPKEAPCFPNDQYYTRSPSPLKCLTSAEIEIAYFYEQTVNKEKILKVAQYIRHHITRHGRSSTYNSL